MSNRLFGGYVVEFTHVCCDTGIRRHYALVRDEREALAVVRDFDRRTRKEDFGTGARFFKASRATAATVSALV